MPRTSKRQQAINRLDEPTVVAVKDVRAKRAMGIDASSAEDLAERFRRLRLDVSKKRYLFRKSRHRRREWKFHLCLEETSDDCLDDREFKVHFRLTRKDFWKLVQVLEDHPCFQRNSSDSRGKIPKKCEHQLLVPLKYYGCEGNGASSVALGGFFGIGSGAVDHCRNNALIALLSMEDQTHCWPDADERKLIASRIKEASFFPHCVGIVDGTLLKLSERPLIHGENCLSRKKFYATAMLVVCDDIGRILYCHVGWPGSVHDNRVWRNCNLCKKCRDMFSNKECPLGDSAFTPSQIMVPPFKNPAGTTISSNQSAFNTMLSKPRVKSEHCIGILKGRFPHLRCIRQKLGNKQNLERIVQCVRGTVIPHNCLIEDDFDEDMMVSDGEDDQQPEGTATLIDNQPDSSRRQDPMHYLSELEETPID